MSLAYMIFFVVWSIFGIRDNVQSDYPKRVIAADLAVSAFAVCGMLVYHLNTTHAGFEHFWKGILVAIVAWEIILGRIDYRHMLAHPDKDISLAENKRNALMGFAFAILFYAPCLYMIFQLGF